VFCQLGYEAVCLIVSDVQATGRKTIQPPSDMTVIRSIIDATAGHC